MPAPKQGSDLKRKHPPNLKKALNQNNTDPPNNRNRGDAPSNPHNNRNKGDAPSNRNSGDNCNVCPPTYLLRVKSGYYDLAYMRGGAIRKFYRNEVKGNIRKKFRTYFARKAHDIIALLLAPTDGQHFDYDGFIIVYDKVVDE